MKYAKLSLSLSILSLMLSQTSFSANITNKIMGVGPTSNPVNPHLCLTGFDLAPGSSTQVNDGYIGGALRMGGCDPDKNAYLGYVGFSVGKQGNKFVSYSPFEGVHIAYTNPGIDAGGNITGKIQYTAIEFNFNLLSTPPKKNSDWEFTGFNLSGLEFGKMIDPVVIPNLSAADASSARSDLADTQALLNAGMNTVRLPVSWGYLQLEGPGKGEINQDYFDSYIKPLLETLTSSRVYAMVDLHAYLRYSIFGKEYSGCGEDGKCPDGTLVLDEKAYADVWTKFYALIKNDPKINMNYILLDLVNEPVDAPNDSVFTIQAYVIKALRDKGFQGYILVEGNSWSGLHSWTTESWKSTDGKTSYTNASLFTRENFAKAGITDLSKIIINAHQYLDSNYSGTQQQCVTDLTTTGATGYNLGVFRDYLQRNHLKAIVTEFGGGTDSASCTIAMTKFLDYLKDNAAKDKDYGFVGWTIWSTGHGWGNYNLRVKPTSYHMQVLKKYL